MKVFICLVSIILLSACASTRKIRPITDDCDNVQAYLEIEAWVNRSNAQLGDSIVATLILKNKTEDTVEFYPKAALYMYRITQSFHAPSKTLRQTLDLDTVAQILPRGEYKTLYTVTVEPKFFSNNYVNTFKFVYIVPALTGKFEQYNKLCGSLESNEIQLNIF